MRSSSSADRGARGARARGRAPRAAPPGRARGACRARRRARPRTPGAEEDRRVAVEEHDGRRRTPSARGERGDDRERGGARRVRAPGPGRAPARRRRTGQEVHEEEQRPDPREPHEPPPRRARRRGAGPPPSGASTKSARSSRNGLLGAEREEEDERRKQDQRIAQGDEAQGHPLARLAHAPAPHQGLDEQRGDEGVEDGLRRDVSPRRACPMPRSGAVPVRRPGAGRPRGGRARADARAGTARG